MKKLITSLLVLIATAIGSVGAYAYDFEVDGLYYNLVSLPDLICAVTNGDNKYEGDIVIPATVEYKNRSLSVIAIEKNAFSDCYSLTSVVIPNSVTEIVEDAFKYCTHLTSVVIPNSVTEIGSNAFRGCSSLTSVEIPNSVTEIGSGAFHDCSSLTSVEIPNSVTTIGSYAFNSCSSLTSVEIPNSVTEIDIYTFYGCSSLTSVEIPNSVTRINSGAFGNCENLTSVRFAGGEQNEPISWETFTREYIAFLEFQYYLKSPWKGCYNLTDLIIERELNPDEALIFFDDVQSAKWMYMFVNKFNDNNGEWWICPIENVTFGCKIMPSWGINYYTGLETINFTDAVEEIEAGALAGCSGLKTINCQSMTPPQLGTGSFTDGQYVGMTVYVPKGSLAAYQAAPEWCNFWELQEYDPEANGINDIQIQPAKVANDVYNMQGVCLKQNATQADIDALAPGLYIIGGKKVLVR